MVWLLKVKGYAIALGSFLLAILGTYLWAKHKGKDQGAQDQLQDDIQASQEAQKFQIDTKVKIDDQVNALAKPKIPVTVPEPIPSIEGAQQVGTSEPGTAAGELRDHWMRD